MKTSVTKIKTGTYPIYIGKQVLNTLNKFLLNKEFINCKLFIITDVNSFKFCLPQILKENKQLQSAHIITIESGEEHKNINTCIKVWDFLSKNGADRKSLLLNVGGGVIGDLGGFVASTYKRGITCINIPTTLLSQVDASVGGKVGVDFNHLKNEIGCFNNPLSVFISPNFLKTLSPRQILSGFAEITKHGLIADKKYWRELRKKNQFSITNLEKLIVRSVNIKNKIVTIDPREKNIRKKLNFGHTVGHAIESFSLENDKNPLTHGEAIAIGIICESYLSYIKKMLSKTDLEEIITFILSNYELYHFDSKCDDEIIELMHHDKKNENNKINFTLLRGIGNAAINKDCEIKQIKESLNYYREQSNARLHDL